MSERVFRMILGGTLLFFLFLQADKLVYAYIVLLLFEGLTNWRVPVLVSRLRFGKSWRETAVADDCGTTRGGFEAERALRLVVAGLLIITFVAFHEELWFLPWFLGFALTLAGITGICPMTIFFRRMGLK